ncbi:MAG TPA: class I SAM-dependent methyltransferase [Anaerolineales bacterium]|nr:class I SAM-dependent methyltransferase [Anaerolineales bacterium]
MDTDLYLSVREKEGRLYSDEMVARLPSISDVHPLAKEWCARSASAARLTRYLSRRPKPLSILDLGCGNGWLSDLMHRSGHCVIGMDQNRYELKQAARVFSQKAGLAFLEADIFAAPFAAQTFDVILLASVLQYFRDLNTLLLVLFGYLKGQGEIHIIDSPLYSDAKRDQAAHRSFQYYSSLGFPQMAEHYFHHCASDLNAFRPKTLYQGRPLTLRMNQLLGRVDSPFPWIMIEKQDVR